MDVRSIFVGDEEGESIIGDADAFGIEARVEGIAGIMLGIEIVGAAGEEEAEQAVGFGRAVGHVERFAVAVNEREEGARSEEHTSELQSRQYLVCRLLLAK